MKAINHLQQQRRKLGCKQHRYHTVGARLSGVNRGSHLHLLPFHWVLSTQLPQRALTRVQNNTVEQQADNLNTNIMIIAMWCAHLIHVLESLCEEVSSTKCHFSLFHLSVFFRAESIESIIINFVGFRSLTIIDTA